MSTGARGYVEHVAIHVKDIHWHMAFFESVLGFTLRDFHGEADNPTQVWLYGGIQLINTPDFVPARGQMNHIGVMADDMEAVVAAGLAYPGVTHEARGRNWLVCPDGLIVEILAASPGAVAQALAVNPRA